MWTDLFTPSETVLWLQEQFADRFWLDGGWGVDALIGRQTREHGDVDIVIDHIDLEDAVRLLQSAGFRHVPQKGSRPCNFVFGCEDRGLVDFHLVSFDANGNGLYGFPEPEGEYPAHAFTGRGLVRNVPVPCMSVTFQIENHNAGYTLREKDRADMQALADAYSIPLPSRLASG